jgi:hypothetical protein
MRRYIPVFAIIWIAAVPLSVKPTWLIGALVAATGLFCFAGLLWRSLGATLTGCVLAVIALALALWWGAASMSVFGAVAFGLALLLLLDSTDINRRFAGAQFEPFAWRAQVAWWIGRGALCFVAGILFTLIASALELVLPTFGRAIIAAMGALAAILAALSVTLSATKRTPVHEAHDKRLVSAG